MVYEAEVDPYCYPGTDVLKNIPGLRDLAALTEFEAVVVFERSGQPLPRGRLSLTHYRAMHRHLFQDVYQWAGKYRTVRIGKGNSVFCYPENVESEMHALFGQLPQANFFADRSAEDFSAAAAHFIADLNAIHPFREGNGRTQNTFLGVLAARAGHSLDLARVNPVEFMDAMIASFHGDERMLQDQILGLMD